MDASFIRQGRIEEQMERRGGTREGGLGSRFIGRGGRAASGREPRGGVGFRVDPRETHRAADG